MPGCALGSGYVLEGEAKGSHPYSGLDRYRGCRHASHDEDAPVASVAPGLHDGAPRVSGPSFQSYLSVGYPDGADLARELRLALVGAPVPRCCTMML